MLGTLAAALAAELNDPAHYIEKGWFQMSVPNLVVIVLMIVVLVLAIALPFPKEKDR